MLNRRIPLATGGSLAREVTTVARAYSRLPPRRGAAKRYWISEKILDRREVRRRQRALTDRATIARGGRGASAQWSEHKAKKEMTRAHSALVSVGFRALGGNDRHDLVGVGSNHDDFIADQEVQIAAPLRLDFDDR
jgi:hypothetical protein